MNLKKLRRYPCVIQNIVDLASRGHLREAVDTLPVLARKGFPLNSKVIAFLIQQCADSKSAKEGRWVHLHLNRMSSKRPSTFLSNHLINMYAKCGDYVKAREVFDKMRERNLYSWNNMLSGYANLGMVKAARRLFDKMPVRDFVSWNTMVVAYVQGGRFYKALWFYIELRRSGVGFNEYSFAGILTACVKLRELWFAQQLHCQVFILGFLSNMVLSSSVMDAYAKCGELRNARRLFDEMRIKDVLAWTTLVSGYALAGDMNSARNMFDVMPERNSFSWNALIAGYAHNGMGDHALELFAEMIMRNVQPDQFTFSSCLFSCASIISPNCGTQLHSHMITAGIKPTVVVMSALIEMYSKCGSLEVAKRVFDTIQNKQHVMLWNTMISALADQGCGKHAIKIFVDMSRLGVKPDGITFLTLLNACSKSGLVQEGLHLFDSVMPDYNITPDRAHYTCLNEVLNQMKKMHHGEKETSFLLADGRSLYNIERCP